MFHGGQYNDGIINGTADGVDSVNYSLVLNGLLVDISDENDGYAQRASGGGLQDTLIPIENIIATEYSDTILGNRFNNRIYGLGGNDAIGGGTGFDTAVYSGNWNGYFITGGMGTRIVTDAEGSEGTDTLNSIERLEFANGVYENGQFRHSGAQAPVADNDTALAAVNGSVNINVLANDRDPDNQLLTISLYTQAGDGTATLQGNGTFTYEPDTDFSGTDSFVYKITDTDDLTAYGTVSVIVSNSAITGGSDGDANDNLIVGTSAADNIDGNGGNDVIQGKGGNDTLAGGSGADTIYGDDGNDELQGGSGNDKLYGGAGNDVFIGNDGFDDYFGGSGADEYHFDLSTASGWAGINESDAQGADTIYLTNVFDGDRIEFEYDSGTDQLNAYYYADDTGGPDFTVSIIASAALAGTGVEYIIMDGNKAYSTANIIAAADYEANNTYVFDIADYEEICIRSCSLPPPKRRAPCISTTMPSVCLKVGDRMSVSLSTDMPRSCITI